MRLVTQTRSLALSAQDLNPPQSRRDYRGFLFSSDRSYRVAYVFFSPIDIYGTNLAERKEKRKKSKLRARSELMGVETCDFVNVYKFVTTCGKGIPFVRFFEAHRVAAVLKAIVLLGERYLQVFKDVLMWLSISSGY